MRPTQMIIRIGKSSQSDLIFQIQENIIADLWIKKMDLRHQWPMDDPQRFYGFDDFATEEHRALTKINHIIGKINQYRPIIHRSLLSVQDQDTLNYLHNIFEIYHGQLDKQNHGFWMAAPEEVRKALADLNIAVHRCESLRTGKIFPRFVCTWFGMPKTETLADELKINHSTDRSEFGGVYLNYVEIGKTAQDMAYDNDVYMADEMFQPFNHYSADFRVDFFDDNEQIVTSRREKINRYFEQNRSFFAKFRIETAEDIRIRPIKFKVAQLLYESHDKDYIISQIRKDQYVSSVVLK